MLNKTNFHYPAMLRVAGKNCVIIGGKVSPEYKYEMPQMLKDALPRQ